jgi:ADP-ribose pyrophosphatase YjhB (NUDIX family)
MSRKETRFGGVLIKASNTNRYFLMLRSTKALNPLTWGLISGGINENEDILDGLKREIREECSIDPSIIQFKQINEEEVRDGVFYYYQGLTDSEFIPTLDFENLDWGWFDKEDLPEPLFPNLKSKIDKYE